jgi:hypothetical protein
MRSRGRERVYCLLASEDEAPVSVVCRRQVQVSRLVNATFLGTSLAGWEFGRIRLLNGIEGKQASKPKVV